jgi:transposase-like protein
MQQVYETLIFMAIGETLDISKYLNGVRIVDTSGKKKFRCRF